MLAYKPGDVLALAICQKALNWFADGGCAERCGRRDFATIPQQTHRYLRARSVSLNSLDQTFDIAELRAIKGKYNVVLLKTGSLSSRPLRYPPDPDPGVALQPKTLPLIVGKIRHFGTEPRDLARTLGRRNVTWKRSHQDLEGQLRQRPRRNDQQTLVPDQIFDLTE